MTDDSGPDPSPLLADDVAEPSPTETISEELVGQSANEPLWATTNGDDGGDDDDESRLPSPPHHRTTPARWFILLSYFLLAMFQNMTFNTYSPIYPAVSKAFPSWTPSFLDWSVNTSNIAYLLFIYPASLMYERWDVRQITLFAATMVFIGAAARCVPVSDGPLQLGITIASMVLNGIGATWMGFGGPVIAERWFPVEERTLATALCAIVAPFSGTAVGFVLGPLFAGSDAALDEKAARMRVDRLFWAEAALCLTALVCCVAYFPDRPEHPPSEAAAACAERKRQKVRREETGALSASSDGSNGEEEIFDVQEEGEERLLYHDAAAASSDGSNGEEEIFDVQEEGEERLLYHDAEGDDIPAGVKVYFGFSDSSLSAPPAGAIAKYWAMCLGIAFPLGVSQGWGSVLYSVLAPLGATEGQAAILGFASTSAGCFGALAVGAALGQCTGRLKAASVSCMAIAAVSFLLFSADASGYFPFLSSDVAAGLAFVTCVIAGATFSASVPLYFELMFENSHGWADAGAGVMMSSFLSATVQIAFTAALALQGPGESTLWTSWAAAGSAILGCVALLGVRVEYRRLSVDQGTALSWTGCRFDREFGCY
eukprot:CAMPEP_0197466722 /NCGR_PEP_ID=MMETSP1175-20131217/65190_1 /TAXON_ID=1003142 /ORGANISM="Triceratium dubium, Strain CCMP147" /LENGTH=599 /DNA_ID=CAMNT_0043002771 /DNA_START=798 /DNA_END=2596 /DNA_ORIENTATION=-